MLERQVSAIVHPLHPGLPADPTSVADVHDLRDNLPGKGRSLKADVPIPCRSAETARRTAERLAPAKAGVVAFSTAGDAELGDYDDEPTIIFKTGQLPAHFEET